MDAYVVEYYDHRLGGKGEFTCLAQDQLHAVEQCRVTHPNAALLWVSLKAPDLDDLLESWAVHAPGMWENNEGPKGWWAVANEDGIVGYFPSEVDACRYRLWMINKELNP